MTCKANYYNPPACTKGGEARVPWLQLARLTLLFAAMLWLAPVRAVLTIEIIGGEEGALPVAVVPFAWKGSTKQPPEDIAAIIAANLTRTGRFAPLPRKDLLTKPHRSSEVNFADWRLLGVDALVVGQLDQNEDGSFRVSFEVMDIYKEAVLDGSEFQVPAGSLRRMGHHISDLVYTALTGEPGAFDSRIAYIATHPPGKIPTRFELQIADSDGRNPTTILSTDKPLMSPAWSPDGKRLAYVSFEHGGSEVVVHDVASGERQVVAAFPGINSAPAWSPNGSSLALTLSKDGNPEIYILHLPTKHLRRLTRSMAIDTKPVWTADGKDILFTSDRGGRPQIYKVYRRGGIPARVTFEGKYNAGPALSPDGTWLAMEHREEGAYRIAIMDLETQALRVLTAGRLDESPSFSPNGRIILYATERNGRGVLAAVTADGRSAQRLTLQGGDVREPAWSPLLHKEKPRRKP